ncbi:MAG: hypothetical protein ACRDG6_07545 [Candidatus Limnocylindria bacterium]
MHFELFTKDAARAKRFCSALFGWTIKDSSMPGVEYYLIEGMKPGGGLNPNQDKPGPVVYFDTEDIDTTIKGPRSRREVR